MDVSIGVPSHPEVPVDSLITSARSIGVDFVELMMEGPGERRRLAEESDRINESLPDSMELLVHLPFGGVDIGAPLEHVREGSLRELKAGIDVAAQLGARKAVFHADSNVRPELWDKQLVRQNIYEAVDKLHEYSQQTPVEVCVENFPGPYASIDDFDTLLEETAAAATIDTGHARVSGYDESRLAAFIEQNGPRVSHLHLNDTRGPRDEHLPFGMGNTEFETIIQALPETWDGTFTIEAITADFAFVEVGVQRLRDILE